MSIIVVGLGPGNGKYLTREAWTTITSGERLYLRTGRHPVVHDFPESLQFRSFDHFYETAENFAEVYEKIVTELLQQAEAGDVIYGVPGHPNVGESTVTRLIEKARAEDVKVHIVPGLSFIEPVLSAVGADALDGLQIFDALVLADYFYPPAQSDTPLLIAQVYNRFVASELKLALSTIYPEDHQVSLIHAAGDDNAYVEEIPIYEIDRSEKIDHLTSLFVPPLNYPATLQSLAETVAVLRSPDGCPWDIEQTPKSLRDGFLEEVYEALDAIDNEDVDNLREELGDILYHLVMQTHMAFEDGVFTLSDVIAGIDAKLKRRHPHVWGDWDVAGTAEVLQNWEALKKQEKNNSRSSLLDGIPSALPALARSQKIQHKVAQVGFDWPDLSGIYEKIKEETAEIQSATTPDEQFSEVGDLFFIIVNLARRLGVDAESALREANQRFDSRFRIVEQLVAKKGLDMTSLGLKELDEIWEEAKVLLANGAAGAKV